MLPAMSVAHFAQRRGVAADRVLIFKSSKLRCAGFGFRCTGRSLEHGVGSKSGMIAEVTRVRAPHNEIHGTGSMDARPTAFLS